MSRSKRKKKKEIEGTLTQSLSLLGLPWQQRLYTNQIAMASSSRLGLDATLPERGPIGHEKMRPAGVNFCWSPYTPKTLILLLNAPHKRESPVKSGSFPSSFYTFFASLFYVSSARPFFDGLDSGNVRLVMISIFFSVLMWSTNFYLSMKGFFSSLFEG